MTSGQRKAHKYIWLVLLVIVPIIMIFSIKDLNVFSSSKSSALPLETSKKNVISSAENDLIKASLYDSHVEIILKTTLKNSSSIVYTMDEKGNKTKIIGQLTSSGMYTFNINNLPKGIVIYDALKNVEITKFSF